MTYCFFHDTKFLELFLQCGILSVPRESTAPESALNIPSLTITKIRRYPYPMNSFDIVEIF